MAYEPKENTGSLWDEPKSRKSNKDGKEYTYYTGDMNVVCPHCRTQTYMWINAFLNVVKSGKKVFNMSFSKKDDGQSVINEQPSTNLF